MYFYAWQPIVDFSLLSSDGTVAGTRVLAQADLGGGTHEPRSLQPHGDAMYFVGRDAVAGSELWRTDGSVAGTRLAKDIRSGAVSSEPTWLTSVGPWLFFLADDGVHGYELWRSDGTEAGTQLVRDIAPGPDSPFFDAADGAGASLGSTGTELLFAAWQQTTGVELWASDGTSAGTRLLRDLAPGPASSSPAEFVRAGGRTYFRADARTSGRTTERARSSGPPRDRRPCRSGPRPSWRATPARPPRASRSRCLRPPACRSRSRTRRGLHLERPCRRTRDRVNCGMEKGRGRAPFVSAGA